MRYRWSCTRSTVSFRMPAQPKTGTFASPTKAARTICIRRSVSWRSMFPMHCAARFSRERLERLRIGDGGQIAQLFTHIELAEQAADDLARLRLGQLGKDDNLARAERGTEKFDDRGGDGRAVE